MKRGFWIAIAVGIVLILIVVVLMFVRLGPKLSLVAPTPTAIPTEAAPVEPVSTVIPSGSACRTGTMVFMALGESQPPRGTDAIRLVRVDYDHKRIDVLALPAQLWVATPGLAARGMRSTTLSNVYLQGKNLAAGDDRARMLSAVNLFGSTLQSNFGYTPEHYFVIKQAAFADFINALGGVDVVLPVVVDGRSEGFGYFPAGAQHLTGAMALDLVRIDNTGIWDRFDRQELIIQAVYQSLLTPQNWDRLPYLVGAFHDNILTDFSVSQMLDVSCILNQPGVVVNQELVGPELLIPSGRVFLPAPGLGSYILQLVGK
jgi:LCP family protein required for cell wall assembly